MTQPIDAGTLVMGPPTSPRVLVRHADTLSAYASDEVGDSRESYLSHFAFGLDLRSHHKANRGSVAGYAGPHWCRWLTLDLDAADLGDALDSARRLAASITDRYGNEPSVFFSGSKGFHLLLDLSVIEPEPSTTFHRTARAFAAAIAARAGVTIDSSIYDIAHIIRLPNTRHARSGLFKRRIDLDALYRLTPDAIRDLAKEPAGEGIGTPWQRSQRLADGWHAAERTSTERTAARVEIRSEQGSKPDNRVPKYLLDFLRFGVDVGERHQTLFRCAAYLTEQGCPPSLVHALLTEPARDVGLTSNDIQRQIRCGIEHACRQAIAAGIWPHLHPDLGERLAIEHEDAPLIEGATAFPFGPNADGPYGPAGDRL